MMNISTKEYILLAWRSGYPTAACKRKERAARAALSDRVIHLDALLDQGKHLFVHEIF